MLSVDSNPSRVARFPGSAEIVERLRHAPTDESVGGISLIVSREGIRQHFSIDASRTVQPTDAEDRLSLPASCMAKLLTATLAIDALAKRGISLEQSVGETTTGFGSQSTSILRNISIRQFLNGTHGLDDECTDPYPLRPDGFIDIEAVCSRLGATPRLITSGTRFSYTDFSMLVVGAVLERVTEQRFGELLKKELLEKLGAACVLEDYERTTASPSVKSPGHICPTSGGALALTATDLVRLAEFFFPGNESGAAERLETMRSQPAAFPGWTNMGTEIGLGWHRYEGGWYGYNAMTPAGGSLMLRMNPDERTAIAVVSTHTPAYLIMSSAFVDMLPEFRNVRPPRFLSQAELAEFDFSTVLGRYESAAWAATVEQTAPRQLQVTVSSRSAEHRSVAEPITRGLRLAVDGCFLTVPVERIYVPYGQFVTLSDGGAPRRYLWSGRRLWRKTS